MNTEQFNKARVITQEIQEADRVISTIQEILPIANTNTGCTAVMEVVIPATPNNKVYAVSLDSNDISFFLSELLKKTDFKRTELQKQFEAL